MPAVNVYHVDVKREKRCINYSVFFDIIVLNTIETTPDKFVLRALRKIDVHLISTLVNKSLYCYYNYYSMAIRGSFRRKYPHSLVDLKCTIL